ncbi:Protein sym1 [Trichoderma ghanense]|uniref:Protein sym1 n=1 Tax=Trichoderma ghanense TaxID=65468 RepID=A0ABY2H1J8_9HYPO
MERDIFCSFCLKERASWSLCFDTTFQQSRGGVGFRLAIMLDSKVAEATFQATVLNGLSGVCAQGITAYRNRSFDEVEIESILRFIVYSILVTPPNYKWQEFLERKFPSRTPVHEPSPASSNPPEKQAQQGAQVVPVKDRLNLTNTAAKFVLDQLFGAPLNTLAFLYLMGGMTFQSQAQIWSNIQRDFWPMLIAGYRVWPIVGLLNLSVVPFDYRQLVGSTAGLFWGIFLSLNKMT